MNEEVSHPLTVRQRRPRGRGRDSQGRAGGRGVGLGKTCEAEGTSSAKTRKQENVGSVWTSVSHLAWLEPERTLDLRVGRRTEAKVGRP